MTRNRQSAAVLSACLACGLAGTALAGADKVKGKMYSTKVAASKDPLVAECGYKLWVPEDSPTIRYIILVNMRAAGKHLFFQDQQWRAMAARTRGAMMYCEKIGKTVRSNGFGASMLKACDQFAEQLKRPELKHAPLVLWGHSMGGRVTQDFVRYAPSRVLTFIIALRAKPTAEEHMVEEPQARKVPGLYVMGKLDEHPADIRAHFERARAGGSGRAWVWLPGQGHWPKGRDRPTSFKAWRAWAASDVVLPWIEAMVKLRMPDGADATKGPVKLRGVDLKQGWLGNIETNEIAPYDKYKGDKSKASWFPNADIARAWKKFETRA